MKNMLPETLVPPVRKLCAVLTRLHRDERGAEGLEKLLILAAVVLPLLGVLIFFRRELKEWVEGDWETISNGGTVTDLIPSGGGAAP